MHLDAIDLKDFYACPLGVVVRRLLGARIRARFGELKDMSMFGLGFAAPYLALFKAEARPCGALMPVELGAIAWPEQGLASSVLVDETELPLDDEAADRLLLVHMLEWSEKSRALLREMWRVLKPNGRLLIVVPNRRGLVGARRHHAVRLWQPVQPPPAHQALEGGHVLAGGMGIRAVHAALQLAHPAEMADVLGAAGACAVADLLRRDPGRGDQAGLCRRAAARAAQSQAPPHRPGPGRRHAAAARR